MVFGLLRLLLGTVMIDVLLFFSVLFFLEDSHTGVLAIHEAGAAAKASPSGFASAYWFVDICMAARRSAPLQV